MTDIDSIEYGKLVNSVENLELKVDVMDSDIKKLLAMAELQDADGNVMTQEQADAFIATLP
jgi:hypothetical protein